MTPLRCNPIPLVALALAAACLPARAQVPSEVTNLTWCAGPAKDCLQWSASAGATEYRLYRGELASLACLPNTARESCLESVITDSTTGPGAITENPAAGRFYWYLLTAANAQAEGTSGTERLNRVSQPRVRNSIGTCPVTCSPAGGGCSEASDCCSSACFAGCQAACCVPAGGTCADYFDCCSGNCNGGTCQSCFALGQTCVASSQCCSGGCTGGLCGVACQENGGACAGNAQCCSGNCTGGACQAPPTDDGVSTVVPDVANAVSATIGRAGGSIQAGGLTLTIPPGALSEDTSITMTPVSDMADSPIQGLVVGAAAFEPEGLLFLKPATLTMPLPAGVFPLDVLGFGSAGDGSDLHLEPESVQGSTISLPVWHFSTVGAANAGEARRRSMATYVPTSEQLRATQAVAAACVECDREVGIGILYGPGCDLCEQEEIRALFQWYSNSVRPRLQAAVGAPSFEVEPALQEWLVWAGDVQGGRFNVGVPPSLQNEFNQAETLATDVVQNMLNRRLDNCTGTTPDSQLRDVIRMADFSLAGALILNPPVEQMARACLHFAITDVSFPAIAAVDSSQNTLTGRVVLHPHVGPDRAPDQIPFDLQVNGSSLGTNADGTFSRTIHASGAQVNVDMKVEAAAPPFVLFNSGWLESLSRPTRARFFVAVRNAGDTVFYDEITITSTEQAVVASRIAGDGLAGATVTYQLSGNGSLNSTSVITNATGKPPDVTYTPSPNAGGDATITATTLGETSIATIHVSGPPTITSVTPSPLFGPPSEFDGVVLTGTVVIQGTNLQGGEIYNDGPFLMLGTATVNPTGTMIQKSYSIGTGVPNVPFHFFVSTPFGSAQVDDTISTSTAGGPPLTSVSPSPVVFRCGVGLPPHGGTIVIHGSNLQGGEIVAAHAQYSDLYFFKLLGSSSVNGAGTTIQREYIAGIGGGFSSEATPMQFLVITPQGMSMVTGSEIQEDIFGTCTGSGHVCHASAAGDGVYEVQGGGFDDAEIVNNDSTLIFTSGPRVGTRASCSSGGVQTLQKDYVLGAAASVGHQFNTYIVGPSGYICLVDQVIADAPDFCHCLPVSDSNGNPIPCPGPRLPWP